MNKISKTFLAVICMLSFFTVHADMIEMKFSEVSSPNATLWGAYIPGIGTANPVAGQYMLEIKGQDELVEGFCVDPTIIPTPYSFHEYEIVSLDNYSNEDIFKAAWLWDNTGDYNSDLVSTQVAIWDVMFGNDFTYDVYDLNFSQRNNLTSMSEALNNAQLNNAYLNSYYAVAQTDESQDFLIRRTPVPEAGTILMLVLGLGCCTLYRKKRS